MMLADGRIGRTYVVCEINLDEKVRRRLEMLGMTHRSKVSVLNKKANGCLIIKIRGARFAIGREFAEGILVEVAEK